MHTNGVGSDNANPHSATLNGHDSEMNRLPDEDFFACTTCQDQHGIPSLDGSAEKSSEVCQVDSADAVPASSTFVSRLRSMARRVP
jgi:hypothetical protein